MQAPRLIFHPRHAEAAVESRTLVAALREAGLLGEARPSQGVESYFAGEHFLELLTFLGCSPVIALSPEEGERYCYIDIETFDIPRLVTGSQAFQPRCRHCRAPIPDWREQLGSEFDVSRASVACPQCGEETGLPGLNWKHAAGVGRQMIIIHNIYLHEAVPGEQLMQTLESLTPASAWDYFYAI